jgi:hypothetical protein
VYIGVDIGYVGYDYLFKKLPTTDCHRKEIKDFLATVNLLKI